MAPESIIAVSAGRLNMLRDSVPSDDVVAEVATSGVVAPAMRMVRDVWDAKAGLALCGELCGSWSRTLMKPPMGMSARRGASQ